MEAEPPKFSAGASADEGEVAAGGSAPETGPASSTASTPPPVPSDLRDLRVEGGGAPRAPQAPAAGSRKHVAPRAGVAALAIAGGAALLGTVAVLWATGGSPPPAAQASGARIAGSVSGVEARDDGGGSDAPLDARFEGFDDAALARGIDTRTGTGVAQPGEWRVARLGDDASIALIDGVIGRRPITTALVGALEDARHHGDRGIDASRGEAQGEAQRVAVSLSTALSEANSPDHFGPKDTFRLACDRASGRVVAYEFASSPLDVWQGREQAQADASIALVGRRLELVPEPIRIRRSVLVGPDLRASLTEAGLVPVDEVLTMLDDALDGHTELSNIRPGARIRIVATQERVDGEFVRWVSLDAVEYFPAAPDAPSVRVYWFGQDEGPKKHHGWYDAKGRQPIHGGWRMPVPLARVVSRFNPHRMHPVLHVVMPHNGVDLASPIGAPVYATAAGVVSSVGFDGPCGNKVEITHPHGMTSVYCHLSRFAPGLHVGQAVEQRQLIAYVGQTGRVTGPHLHFGMRRDGVFIDPMTLRLDGMRVVPRTRRDDFDRLRAQLDAELDTIPLPAPGAALIEPPDTELFLESPP